MMVVVVVAAAAAAAGMQFPGLCEPFSDETDVHRNTSTYS